MYRPLHVHYILLQEHYHVALSIRSMIDRLRPDYIYSGDSWTTLGRKGLSALNGVDLVISDIQLSEGLLVDLIPPGKCNNPVIILAENNSYKDMVEKYNVVDYLLKPVSLSDIENSLLKFEEYLYLNT